MIVKNSDLIALLPRAPEKRSTAEIATRLSAQGLHLSARSLQRRLTDLCRDPSFICDDSSKPYGWQIAKNAALGLGKMPFHEAVALKLAEAYLREAIPSSMLSDLAPFFRRADEKLRDESLYRAWFDKVRLVPASQPLGKPVIARNVLENAYDGVLHGQVLNVKYQAQPDGALKSYAVEPLAIVVRGPVTYLVAQLPGAPDLNLLALHRFKSIQLTDTPISQRSDFNLEQFIASGELGFMPTGERRVHIRFYNGAGDHLRETPIAANQVLKEVRAIVNAKDLIVTLPINEQFKWWLLAFADRAEVIAPAALRREIGERLTAAAGRYVNRLARRPAK